MWAFEAAAPICFAFQVEVGTRVKVVRGRRALGATGVVFWVGANKYGPGMRLGIHADHGKTLWIDLDHVEALGDDDVELYAPDPAWNGDGVDLAVHYGPAWGDEGELLPPPFERAALRAVEITVTDATGLTATVREAP